VRVHNNRVARFAEFAGVDVLPFHKYADPHEHAGASSGTFV
jgi:hypothetical protein